MADTQTLCLWYIYISNYNHVGARLLLITHLYISESSGQSASYSHIYRVIPREFIMNWATVTARIVNKNIRFKVSFKVHNIHTKSL